MLHGIVPVHVDAMPTTGPSSRAGSMPMARKCARAPARVASCASAARSAPARSSCGVPFSSTMARTLPPRRAGARRGVARLESRRMTPPDRPEVRVRITLRWRDMDELVATSTSPSTTSSSRRGGWRCSRRSLTEDRAFVLARVELDHLREVRRDGRQVEVVVRVARLGRSSLEVEHDLVRVDGTGRGDRPVRAGRLGHARAPLAPAHRRRAGARSAAEPAAAQRSQGRPGPTAGIVRPGVRVGDDLGRLQLVRLAALRREVRLVAALDRRQAAPRRRPRAPRRRGPRRRGRRPCPGRRGRSRRR